MTPPNTAPSKPPVEVFGALKLILFGMAFLFALSPIPALSEETVVSTEICGGLWIIPLVWAPEGREPQDLIAVFDTGATTAFIDPDALERISGQRVAEGKRARMEDMSVAGNTFTTFKPEVKDLDHLSRALGRRLDAFLPFQTFANFLLILDYPAGEMRIKRGELPKPDDQTVFNAKGRDDRPWLKIRLGRIERRVLIDSGSAGRIAVEPHKKLEWASEPIPLRLFQGMYDVEMTKVGRLDGQATIGPLIFDQPLVTLTDDTERIGAQVLRNYVLTFDQKNRRMRMEPAVTGPVEMPSYRGTGVILLPVKDYFEIAMLVPGSPAEEVGLKKGDRVTHLDGVPIMDRGCRDFDGDVEDSMLITVTRDGEPREYVVPIVVLVP